VDGGGVSEGDEEVIGVAVAAEWCGEEEACNWWKVEKGGMDDGKSAEWCARGVVQFAGVDSEVWEGIGDEETSGRVAVDQESWSRRTQRGYCRKEFWD